MRGHYNNSNGACCLILMIWYTFEVELYTVVYEQEVLLEFIVYLCTSREIKQEETEGQDTYWGKR